MHVTCYVLCYSQIPGLCSGIEVSVVTVHDALVDCRMFVGYLAVYRVCFSLAAFFFLFMVLMIGVRSSRDPRSAIQNGWAFNIVNSACNLELCSTSCL